MTKTLFERRLRPSFTTSNATFTDPARFDPERFAPRRAEHEKHPHAFAPQGAGAQMGHKCAGFDLSTIFMQIFGAVLLGGYSWELPAQDRSLRFDRMPPEPRSGLIITVNKSP